MLIHHISNTPRDYGWGVPGGISATLGWPQTSRLEAELWLGAHPGSPSRLVGSSLWGDLFAWEMATGQTLPYLLKILAADRPLSLQAHPASAQATAGFAREQAAGIARDAANRCYKDPHSKPELIVALDGGFEALCGFRPVQDSLAQLGTIFSRAESEVAEPFARWYQLLKAPDGIYRAVAWLLSGDDDAQRVVAELERQAAEHDDLALIAQLARHYPADPGLAVAMLLNHITLQPGECLWLPAGNIHAYLRGIGVELMGPSDNVLRGGLTPKHIDREELLKVLDFTGMTPPLLAPVPLNSHARAYRPAGATFDLIMTTGDVQVQTGSASIAIALDGDFRLAADDRTTSIARGEAVFVGEASHLTITGSGHLALAYGRV